MRELGDRLELAWPLNNIGRVFYYLGDSHSAAKLFEETIAARRELGATTRISRFLDSLGMVAYSRGEYDAAKALFQESLIKHLEEGEKGGVATTVEWLGLIPETPEQQARSARLLGAAEAARGSIGPARPLGDQATFNTRVGDIREVLGEDAFAAAWEEGRAMTLEQAVAYVLGEGAATD